MRYGPGKTDRRAVLLETSAFNSSAPSLKNELFCGCFVATIYTSYYSYMSEISLRICFENIIGKDEYVTDALLVSELRAIKVRFLQSKKPVLAVTSVPAVRFRIKTLDFEYSQKRRIKSGTGFCFGQAIKNI